MSENGDPPRGERPLLTFGVGASDEEAAAAQRRAKCAQVPVADVTFPATLSGEEVDEEIRTRVRRILFDMAEINALLVQKPAGLTNDYIEAVQLRLLDIYRAADDIWDSVNEGAARTFSGIALRQQRLGNLIKRGGTFSFRPKKKRD